jgi:glycosyltransferase involved in cell wall biosynthesis
MRIWVYTICYNEQHFVKNFLAAYSDAERIIAYDNQSTDNTVPLLLEDPRVTVRSWDSGNQIRDDKYLEIKNNCWKEAKGLADWATVVDFDEIFTRAVLTENNPCFNLDLTKPYNEGKTIIKPYGYNMVSIDAPLGEPLHPYHYCKKGVYHWPQEKPCCFRPDKLEEINFVPGCHGINPIGEANIYNCPEYKLLHFKLWNMQLYIAKIKMAASRMSEINKANGWGEHYLWPIERHYKSFMDAYAASRPLFEIKRTDKLYV